MSFLNHQITVLDVIGFLVGLCIWQLLRWLTRDRGR